MSSLNQVLRHPKTLVGTDLDAWFANGGGVGLANALGDPSAILPTLEAAGLRGMGGAGFPIFRKWGFMLPSPRDGGDRYFVVNGNEDEPGTFKDRALLAESPHQVIEGALIAALALDVNQIVLYLNPGATDALAAAETAISQWHPHLDEVAATIGQRIALRVVCSSGLYIGGEETAVIATVEGGFPFPRQKPPFPAQSGVHGRPTTVNNVETVAHVTHILRHGAEWYRNLGLGEAVGTKLYSLSGDVLRPGLYELPMGTTLRELVFTHGGGMLQGKAFKAVFTGGPSNTILTAEDLDAPLDWDSLRAYRSRLGTGAMIVISEGASIVRRVADYVEFFADGSCGQCPPCKIGTRELAGVLRTIDAGRGTQADLAHIEHMCGLLPGSGRCALVDGAITVVDSALAKLRDEFERLLVD
ncbi:complex I 51 kDa subunit family protein [Candidatus Chloroploca asiatica]|uniref:NADH-quinone oxidoreductase subunit F n=1 Tax=Candidatus Chloroploca asiatica TaxID=1506545 RepID=A0A2H3L3Y1_9CHLR|nr:NADH-ubiquinone oxidoreductase-F iron-sulfur binding region domain-containing protein [Candidatus Chloroploca asiatica]PDV97850.1 NADH-quinone oxidoreductase subunit F [Candidatus Chloroploca asiatica]